MLKIYGYNTFNPLKVLCTAEELGLDYEYLVVDLAKGENRSADYRAIHPLGKVPALEHNGQCIAESGAICRYLARISDNRLYSDDAMQAAHIDQHIDMMNVHIGRWLAMIFWEEVIVPKFFQGDPDAGKITEANAWLEKQLPTLENDLTEQPFLCGPDISIADTFSWPYFTLKDITSISLAPYPALQQWYDRMAARPGIKSAMRKIQG